MLPHKSQAFHLHSYDRPCENKKYCDENQCFNWIKPIHWCQLVVIGWLADINLTITYKNENTMGGTG